MKIKEKIIGVFRNIMFWYFLVGFFFCLNLAYSVNFKSHSDDFSFSTYIHQNAIENGRIDCTLYLLHDEGYLRLSEDDIELKGFTADISIDYKSQKLAIFSLKKVTEVSPSTVKTIIIRPGAGIYNGVITDSITSIEFSIKSELNMAITKLVENGLIIAGFLIIMLVIPVKSRKKFFIFYFLTMSNNITYNIPEVSTLNLDKPYLAIGLYIELLVYCILSIYIAKHIYGNLVYTIIVIAISTFCLFEMAYLFSQYYFRVFGFMGIDEIASEHLKVFDSDKPMGSLEYLTKNFIFYCKFSFRYFFEFPPDKYLNMVSLLQFMVGKIYDVVIFGSIANCIIKAAKKRNNSS